jgi:hypothetical protein
MEEQAVGHVLQVGKGLALPANQAAGIIGFDIEKNTVVKRMLLHGGIESEEFKELGEGFFGLSGHRS